MDPILPLPNVGSQIERALIAYIWEIWPTALLERPAFHFSNDWKARDATKTGLLDLLAFGSTENPAFTGNNDYNCRIVAKWPGANQPGQENKDFHWSRINQLIGVPEAALKLADESQHNDYRIAAYRISAAGRRLAVFGTPGVADANATDIANNDDMADFFCDWVKFNGAERAKNDPEQGIVLTEQRNWLIRAYNGQDDSVFPALTFDGDHTLTWTFTVGGVVRAEPAHWVVQKSVDGQAWLPHEVLGPGERSSDITGATGQYFRVFRSDGGVVLLDPESNTVKAI